MAEPTKNPGDKLSVAPTKTLTLKGRGVEQGVVRQSFSHGRTKAVVVEKVKRRVGGAPGKPEALPPAPEGAPAKRPTATARPAAVPPTAAPSTVPAQTPAAAPKPSGVVLRTLTDDEQKARVHALADARLREAEERKIAEEEAQVRAAR
jgi:translation initiation factor IF-2